MGSAKNILIANAFWDEEASGGSYRISSDFARYLAKRGHHVHYLCGTLGNSPAQGETRNGVRLWQYRMPPRSRWAGSKFISHFLASNRLARRIRSQENIHVLNAHSQFQYLGAATALGRTAKRYFSSHSPLPDEMESNGVGKKPLGKIKLWAFEQLERWVISISNGVQSFSEFEASLLLKRYGGRIQAKLKVIPGWVDYGRFSSVGESREEVRKRMALPWTTRIPLFLSIRRLVPRMGLEGLIEAASILKQKGHGFSLFIGGDGPGRDSLASLIQSLGLAESVKLLGRISESDLLLAYRAADCVVLPSRSLECFGLTILEAYSAGTPVIATPIGAVPEVIEPSSKSWLTDDISPVALADRMEAFLEGDLRANESLLRAYARSYDIETRAAVLEDWISFRNFSTTC